MDSLSSWLSRHGSLEPGDAVGWVIRAARSLETLHLQGKVHGALSTDAFLLGGTSPSLPGQLHRPEARPEYTSPERLKTGRPSAADDAWALALVLYVALTSYHPFEGEDEDDTLDKIRSGPVPPLVAFGIVDDALQQILQRMLERDLLHRVVAVEPFRRALEGWASLPEELPPLDGIEELLSTGAALPGHASLLSPVSQRPPLPLPSLSAIPPARPSAIPPARLSPPPAAPSPRPPSTPAPRPEPQESLTPTAPLPPARSLPPSPATPTASRPAPAAPPRGKLGVALLFGALLAGGGLWWSQQKTPTPVGTPLNLSTGTTTSASATTTTSATSRMDTEPSASPSVPSVPSVPSASASTSASAVRTADAPTPAPSAPASPPAAPGEGCFLAPFPADTFSKVPPAFASLCKETDPRKGATTIRDEVIRVSVNRRSSPAMTEWGVLSWYEMVVFAAVRGRCCPGAAPLDLPEVKPCASLKDALNEIGKAAAGPLDRSALAAPLKRYDEGLQCILRVGATGHYGRTRPPLGDSVDALKQALDRMR